MHQRGRAPQARCEVKAVKHALEFAVICAVALISALAGAFAAFIGIAIAILWLNL